MLEKLSNAMDPYLTLIKVTCSAIVIFCAFTAGYIWSSNKAETKAASIALIQQEALGEKIKEINKLNGELADAEIAQAMAYQRGLDANKKTSDQIIADLKSGNLRLRRQLSCTSELLRDLPDSAAIGQRARENGQCGLSASDVEFLIRFAQRTNDLRDQVNNLITNYNNVKSKIDQLNKAQK